MVLLDSLPKVEMKKMAVAVLMQVCESLDLPDSLPALLREVGVDRQSNNWVCGPRVAIHARRALVVESGTELRSGHFPDTDDNAILEELRASAGIAKHVLEGSSFMSPASVAGVAPIHAAGFSGAGGHCGAAIQSVLSLLNACVRTIFHVAIVSRRLCRRSSSRVHPTICCL